MGPSWSPCMNPFVKLKKEGLNMKYIAITSILFYALAPAAQAHNAVGPHTHLSVHGLALILVALASALAVIKIGNGRKARRYLRKKTP